MTGGDVGRMEKKQGRFTFPERNPVTGLIMDNAVEAERQKAKGLNQYQLMFIVLLVYLVTALQLFIFLHFFHPDRYMSLQFTLILTDASANKFTATGCDKYTQPNKKKTHASWPENDSWKVKPHP